MKFAALGALLALLQSPFSPARPQDGGPAIEGVVVRAGTGEPFANAQVTLTRADASLTAAQARSQGSTSNTAQTVTDRSGRFAFSNIKPGSYRIAAARNGYAKQEYGQRVFGGPGRVLTVASAEARERITISLTPAGTVTGVVRDSSGEPLVGLQVRLLRHVYGATGQRTFMTAGTGRTDDRGEYRVFWVTPGRYYLVAHPLGSARAVAILGEPGSPNEIFETRVPPTYYPGTIDVSQASLLDVRPGAELSGIDISISPQNLYRVRGSVVDPASGQPPRSASITIVPRGPAATTAGLLATTSPYNPADGTFELRDVAPGAYLGTRHRHGRVARLHRDSERGRPHARGAFHRKRDGGSTSRTGRGRRHRRGRGRARPHDRRGRIHARTPACGRTDTRWSRGPRAPGSEVDAGDGRNRVEPAPSDQRGWCVQTRERCGGRVFHDRSAAAVGLLREGRPARSGGRAGSAAGDLRAGVGNAEHSAQSGSWPYRRHGRRRPRTRYPWSAGRARAGAGVAVAIRHVQDGDDGWRRPVLAERHTAGQLFALLVGSPRVVCVFRRRRSSSIRRLRRDQSGISESP